MTNPTLIIAIVLTFAAVVYVARALLDHDLRRAQLHREIAMHERAMTAPVAELAAAVEALTAAAAALRDAAGERGPSRVGQRVNVHVTHPNDHTLFGVVVGDYIDRLVLDDAEYVHPRGNRPLPGRQDIDPRHVAWVDNLGAVAVVPDTAPVEA